MSYLNFRVKCYQEELRQWLESVKQLSVGIVSLFPLALMALIFIPAVVLGTIADPHSSNRLYFTSLWSYVLLVNSWMLLQRDGIRASRYRRYDNTLRIHPIQRHLTELGILFVAGNLLLFAPIILFILMVMNSYSSLDNSQLSDFVPIIGLITLNAAFSLIAVYSRYPIVSLFLFPLFLMHNSSDFSKISVLTIWLPLCFFEAVFGNLIGKLKTDKFLTSFFFLNADRENSSGQALRFVSLILTLIVCDYFIKNTNKNVLLETGYVFSFICSLIVGSKVLELNRLQQRYQFYLFSIGVTRSKFFKDTLIYMFMYGAIPSLIMLWFNVFEMNNWILYFFCFLATVVGGLVNQKYFLVFPIITSIVYWLILSHL